MKVLFISSGDAKYGTPKCMMETIDILRRDFGVEIVLLTRKRNILNTFCDEKGIENYSVFYRDIMSSSSYESVFLNLCKHGVKYAQYILGGIKLPLISKTNIDFLSFDIIHSNTNRVDIGAEISRKYKIPHIWHIREVDVEDKPLVYYKSNWQGYMNKNTTAYIAVSEAVKSCWSKNGLDAELMHVVYDGVDNTQIKRKSKREDDNLRIVSVGRVEKGKGQLDIIKAVCTLEEAVQKRISVDFLGDVYGEYKVKIDAYMNENNCKAKVNFLGYCSDIYERLQNYDVGITSSYAEGFGRTTVEYMFANLLTIATDMGPNLEIIQDRETGLLYELGNSEELARILKDIVHNKERYQEIAEAGNVAVNERFTAKANAHKIYGVYEKVLREK